MLLEKRERGKQKQITSRNEIGARQTGTPKTGNIKTTIKRQLKRKSTKFKHLTRALVCRDSIIRNTASGCRCGVYVRTDTSPLLLPAQSLLMQLCVR